MNINPTPVGKNNARKRTPQPEKWKANQAKKLRQGKLMNTVNPSVIHPNIPVKQLKMRDVKTLLMKHFGENWQDLEELKFYSYVLNNAEIQSNKAINDTEELECEPREEAPLLLI